MNKNLNRYSVKYHKKVKESSYTTMSIEQVAAQITAIAEQLQKLSDTQNTQDGRLAYLFEKIDNKSLEQTQTPVENKVVSAVDLFRIPDPIKSIPNFDGNRKQLSAWLKTAENTLLIFQPLVSEQQFGIYIQAVMNKIEGRTKDILCLAGNPQTFCEIKEILMDALGDRQELSYYKAQLWSTKQGDAMAVHSYFNKIKEIVQNIKSLSRQNQIYSDSWSAINAFIEEDALAAFISGLRKPYFGYAQAAKPKCIEEAYAFLCKFSSNELISNNVRKPLPNSHQTKTNFYNTNQSKDSAPNQRNKEFKKQTYSVRESPIVPMEVDLSMRSKNTTSRKMIHNHETVNNKDEHSQEYSTAEPPQLDEDNNLGNFQESPESDTED